MAQLKEAIFGVDPVEVDVVRGDPQVDLEKVIEHDLLDSPSRDNSFAPSLIPNEEEARLCSLLKSLKASLPCWSSFKGVFVLKGYNWISLCSTPMGGKRGALLQLQRV